MRSVTGYHAYTSRWESGGVALREDGIRGLLMLHPPSPPPSSSLLLTWVGMVVGICARPQPKHTQEGNARGISLIVDTARVEGAQKHLRRWGIPKGCWWGSQSAILWASGIDRHRQTDRQDVLIEHPGSLVWQIGGSKLVTRRGYPNSLTSARV